MRDTARALLKEMHPEAVRVAEGRGIDVWAVYTNRKNDPFRWEQVKRAASVIAALQQLSGTLGKMMDTLSKCEEK